MEQYLPFGVTLLTILSNGVGANIKEISDKYKISITPAPFTFSIWGIIYSLLLYITFTNFKEFLYTQTPYGSIFTLFVISAILNATWIQVWGKNLELSSVILLLLAFVLIIITSELNKANVDKLIIYTFGIYTAWAICAGLLNISTSLINKKILDDSTVKIIVVIILSILPFLAKNIFGEALIPMLATFIWASFGIIMNGNNNLLFIGPIISSLITMFN